MKELDLFMSSLGAVSALAAAGLFLYSSRIEVPDNIDTMMGEIQRIGRWNSYGCWAAFVGALCASYVFARQTWGS
ncbi:hypothetical protein FHR70_001515 [Microvirga lupini]|uniref:Uncharacterized protein n=1 Tax=Microvirga lupini TaxID=420324 RepID=A0A7W4VJW9_9HYPH|nr:hypothetical protein [Microvirga lupini]MBB3018461.1 hypothetical protein [Microvirga lupini]